MGKDLTVIKFIYLPSGSKFLLQVFPMRMKTCPHDAQSSFVHNSQKLETTQMDITEKMDTQIVLFKKGMNSTDMCNNMSLPDMLSYRRWTQKSTHCVIPFIAVLKQAKLIKAKKIRAVVASRWGDYLERDTKGLPGKMEIFCTMSNILYLLSKLYSSNLHI